MDSGIAIFALVIGLVSVQVVALLWSHRQTTEVIKLASRVCETLSESRRADHRDHLAADRFAAVLIEKIQCPPTWSAEKHLRERAASEENQARVMAAEARSRQEPRPQPVAREASPDEYGVPATTLEAAQE